MCMYLIQKEVVDEIKIEWMVPGHSFMPCDRGFGRVEQQFRRKDKICSPEEYREITRSAAKDVEEVHEMENPDGSLRFFKWRELEKFIQLRKAKALLFSKGKTFRMRKEEPFILEISTMKNTEKVDYQKKSIKEKHCSI